MFDKDIYLNVGAGYPWAGQTTETELSNGANTGRASIIDNFGDVEEIGSKRMFSYV